MSEEIKAIANVLHTANIHSSYIDCPLCGDTKKRLGLTFKHNFDEDGYLYHCFNCDTAGYVKVNDHNLVNYYKKRDGIAPSISKSDATLTYYEAMKEPPLTEIMSYVMRYPQITLINSFSLYLMGAKVVKFDPNGRLAFMINSINNDFELENIGYQVRLDTGSTKVGYAKWKTVLSNPKDLIVKSFTDYPSGYDYVFYTEDIVSAYWIRFLAAEQKFNATAIALLGTNLNMNDVDTIRQVTKQNAAHVIWLDHDNSEVQKAEVNLERKFGIYSSKWSTVHVGDPKKHTAKKIIEVFDELHKHWSIT